MSIQDEEQLKRKGDDISKEEKKTLKKAKKEEEKKKKKHHHRHKEEKDKHHKHKKEKKSKKHDDLDEKTSEEEPKESLPVKDVANDEEKAAAVVTKEKSEPAATSAEEFIKENEITITDPLKSEKSPILSFKALASNGVDAKIVQFFSKFKTPTPIQSATWPYLLERRDLVGIAETGSGKTFAFAVPAINHILQTSSGGKKSKGIKVLAVSPTRELACQINDNIQELVSSLGMHSVCVYGGVSKEQQMRALKNADIVVATPGRLNDLLNDGSCDLSKVSYLVLDEADRMLEKGFEDDIKNIFSYCPSQGRQTVMFTATWPTSVRELATNYQTNAVKVTVGESDDLRANIRVEQIVQVIDPRSKSQKLYQILKDYNTSIKKGERILIFALYKKEASRVESDLRYRGYNVAAIHGDLSQDQRTKALEAFKSGKCPLMLATDVAARGLDIPSVKLVINLTFPLTVEDYVHRIGRTGRAGLTGKSITLFTEHEKHLSGALINVLRAANQPVPDELLKFGGHTKKKEHSVYGAFFKEAASDKPPPKKIKFDV